MGDKEAATSPFFQAWLQEFARAIETFSGESAKVNCKAAGDDELAAALKGSLLWWKQTFLIGEPASAQQGIAWIGAPEATWSALGVSRGATGGDARGTYTEMLKKSLASTATVLGTELQKKITYGESAVENPSTLGSCERVAVSAELKGKALPAMFAAVEPALAKELSAASPAASPGQVATEQIPRTRNLIPLLDRVIDLELPFSVVLGHATLPIRNLLQLTAGSLIELDHYVDQPVELRVQGAVVAHCEVVTVEGNYGIRILEIISPEERMNLQQLPGKTKHTGR